MLGSERVVIHVITYLIAKSNPVPENPSLPVYPLGQGPHLLRKNRRKIKVKICQRKKRKIALHIIYEDLTNSLPFKV